MVTLQTALYFYSMYMSHRIKIHIEGPLTSEALTVSVLAHVALRMLAAIFPTSQ
jgi:hypothetical protein